MARPEIIEDDLGTDVVSKDGILPEKLKANKLLQWTLRQTSRGSIFLEGYLNNTGVLWRSSCIKSRISARQLCTFSGSVYELVGAIDFEASLQHGVSHNLVEAFRNGFPEDWEDHLNNNISVNEPDDTDMELQTTRYDTSTFIRTKSGRIVIPRLASWRGERIIWEKNGNFHISSGFLEALEVISEESLTKLKARRRKERGEMRGVVAATPKTKQQYKPHSIWQTDRRDNESAAPNLLKHGTRNKASISKETIRTTTVQKENSVPKTNLNSCRRSERFLSSSRCHQNVSCSETCTRTISAADASIKRNRGRSLTNHVTGKSMSEELIFEQVNRQRSLPDEKLTVTANNKKPAACKSSLLSQETHSKCDAKKLALCERLQKTLVLTRGSGSQPWKLELDKCPSRPKSMPAKSTKRKGIYDDPLPKRVKRNDGREKPVAEISNKQHLTRARSEIAHDKSNGQDEIITKKSLPTQEKSNTEDEIVKKKPASRHKFKKPEPTQEKNTDEDEVVSKKPGPRRKKEKPESMQEKSIEEEEIVKKKPASRHKVKKPELTQEMSTNEDEVVSKKPGPRRKKENPESMQEKSTDEEEIIRNKPVSQRKTAKPERSQEKNTNQEDLKKPTFCKPTPRRKAAKTASAGNADISTDDSCVADTPCARSSKKPYRPEAKKKLARPGTLRYEEDIRRFISEHNQDEDDDDFLATTPFRGTAPIMHISESFLEKVKKDNDDEDINMLTPKSMGGLPSPFTPRKTPDISGGFVSELIQPLNMKHVDQLVYRINKRRKNNPTCCPQTAPQVTNRATTPMLPKLSDHLGDYMVEALSDPESGDDEDKDYYFSDEETA